MIALGFNQPRFSRRKKPKHKSPNASQHHVWTDAQLLAALDLQDAGMSRAETARLLSMAHDRPFTRMSVTGALDRIRKETDAISCLCERPENRDGGMPADWWHR